MRRLASSVVLSIKDIQDTGHLELPPRASKIPLRPASVTVDTTHTPSPPNGASKSFFKVVSFPPKSWIGKSGASFPFSSDVACPGGLFPLRTGEGARQWSPGGTMLEGLFR